MTEAPIDVGIPLSRSAANAARYVGEERIRSSALIQEIIKLHPGYAGGKAGKLAGDIRPQGGELRTAEDWLREVATLFDPDKVTELTGRLVILGLSRIDPSLATCESCNILVKELLAEHTPPFDTLLREDGGEEDNEDKPQDRTALTVEDLERLERAPNTVAIAALRAADMLAVQASRQADSVLLLAGLLYHGISDESASAGRIWRHLMQTKHADGMDLSGYRGPPVFDVLNLPSNDYPISVSPNWAELEDYPADIMYASWLLGRSSSDLTWPEGFEPRGNMTSPEPPSDELERLLAGARQLAANTSPNGPVRARHLLGAMLSARLVDPLPLAQEHLQACGYDLAQVRQVLLGHIRDAPDGEPPEIWEAVLLTPPERTQPSAGYLTDMVDAAAKDHLDIEAEVEAIAYVLTSKQVHPPLSLGLFGDWGSGKSFFMAKLKHYVSTIAARYLGEEMATGEPAQWCSRVLQIDFNAWHYSDANLWASLVTHIYDQLYGMLTNKPSDEKVRKQLESDVHLAKDVVRAANVRLREANKRVRGADKTLREKRKERQDQEKGVRALINDLRELLEPNEQDGDELRMQKARIQEELTRAANALGYPEAAKSYDALVELDADLQSFSGRLGMLSVSLLRTPWTTVLLALLILGFPIVVSLGLTFFAEEIDIILKRVIDVSALVVSLGGGLRYWIGRGTGLIDTVESSLQAAQEIRQQRIESNEVVLEAKNKLIKAQNAEKAAQENLQAAQAELQRLETELKELRPERRLLRLIEERSRTAAYSQHLGIISLIRADFDQISKLLVRMSRAERDLKKELPPIQRIILYIDDLDRCRPDRVVEVLEAVHLLLAFPLFVVVVGVDPRWLRHSLTKHYPATLAPAGKHVSGDGPTGPSLISTPQDYLEKIFQIPFALRPVGETGYHNMVTELLAPLEDFEPVDRDVSGEDEEQQDEVEETESGTVDEDVEPADEGEETEIATEDDEKPGVEKGSNEGEEQPQPPPLPPLTLREISPRQLEFTKQEKEEIEHLWALFRTPRTVKRFVNIYRLLRTGLADEAEVKRFENTEYEVALLLLAVMTSFPNQSSRFLYRLDAWLESDETVTKARNEATLQWGQLLDALRETGGEDGSGTEGEANAARNQDAASRDGDQETKGEANTAGKEDAASRDGNRGNGGPPRDEDPAWLGMIECLKKVTEDGFQKPFSRETASDWAKKVARYSFSIHPDQVL